MKMSLWTLTGLCIALSGCVLGSGPCLFLEPVQNKFTGTLHFRSYPSDDGIDQVPILTLARTVYIYAPAQSHQCLPANEVQLVGWSQFPPDVPDNSRVHVEGTLFAAASAHQHTAFLVNVRNVFPDLPAPAQKPKPDAH